MTLTKKEQEIVKIVLNGLIAGLVDSKDDGDSLIVKMPVKYVKQLRKVLDE